ncbi:MAG: hypothetical protein QM724_03935 [Flavobacteriales bacterium]
MWCGLASAQGTDNRVRKRVVLDRDTVTLDSLSIVPGSFSLWRNGAEVPATDYQLNPFHARVVRTGRTPTDTLEARYRAMPLLLGGPVRHKDPNRVAPTAGDRNDPFKYTPDRGNSDPLGISGLNKSGSISRGIVFGNGRDLSVNSALNLELSGKLTDKINVLASVTDNNIPIQAGGNTLELQDFDQVFIKLFDDKQELIAGDFTLQRPKSWFLTYLKKTKGLSYTTRTGADGKRGMLGVSAAISKGKFARNLIQGIEGVQGPYRLSGDAGSTFIIVLSGTERIYVDGQLLTRGLDNDYVIDYNTAEITFTAKRLITKDRRIVAEFQYSDKNYARSLVRLTDQLELGKTSLHFDLYTEQDHKNQPLQQSLTDAERAVLAEAGDDPLRAVVPGADSVAYSADEVLYARIDSLGYSPVYRYSTNADSARYRVSFSNVGTGNGDYVQQQFTPNGRVFQWMAPQLVNGVLVHQGNYAPVRVLVPPRAQRVLAIGADHRFSARTKAWSEVAFSDYDRNTFSSLDQADDQGLAIRAGLSHAIPISKADTTLQLVVGTDNEWRSANFSVVERYRPVEFERNWNALTIAQDADQVLATASAGLQAKKKGTATLSSSTFQVRDRYAGYRQALVSDLHLGRYDIAAEGSLLNTAAGSGSSEFLRHKARITRRFGHFTLGARDEQERNRFRSDTIAGYALGSYQFHDWEGFVQNADTARVKFRLGGGQRRDQGLKAGGLVPLTEATTYSANFDLGRSKIRKLATTFTYRRLRIIDSTLTAQKPEDTWLARVEHGHNAWKGALSWDVFYEFGSGLEQRREFIYVQVPTGQGLYVWRDYNGNGQKELNEFELASFGYEADYIRVFVQTNDYVRTYCNQLSASAELRPATAWGDAKGLKGFLGKWSDAASFRTDRKTASDDPNSALNPFLLDPLDPALVAFSGSARNTVYYDRSSRAWSIDHTWQSDRTKSLLLNGFESRVRESNLVHVRWNTTSQWMLEVEAESGRSANNSDLLSGRTYAIDQRSGKPKLTWQPSTRLRALVSFKYTEKRNSTELGGEHADLRDLGAELRYNTAGKGAIQFNMNLVGIAYDGTVDSSLGTEMLAGLKPGTNATWSVTIQRKLSDHLQVDLTYNGRRSEGVPVVHIGGAQVRAYF